ncbi:hypothetical protein EDB89DRAFT_461302 [Lactarius sanguifluus]|nr:hypothetical protein EDB89DRAFT_461302 [Lactarius sanguifluus]
MSVRASDVCLILVAIIFPPAAAAFVTGCSCDLLINICLTMYVCFLPLVTAADNKDRTQPIHSLGYLPGHIHAFWLIYRRMKAEEIYGTGRYIYIGNGVFEPGPGMHPIAAQTPYQRGYGATAVGP